MPVPEILYRLTWIMPDDDRKYTAVMNHDATMSLAVVLKPAGATVYRDVVTGPEGRQTAAHGRDGATGGDGLDASDRAAMARLAQRAFGRRAD